jgi:hypothetical protein
MMMKTVNYQNHKKYSQDLLNDNDGMLEIFKYF